MIFNIFQATQIDDTDVYTLHHFGRLALKNNVLDLAEYAFEKCMDHNPSHWSAADGLLQTLCCNHNVLGALGLALKLHKRNPRHKRANKVLSEILTEFKSELPFYEQIFGAIDTKSIPVFDFKKEESVFPTCYPDENKEEKENHPNIIIKPLSWLSVGQQILQVYNDLKSNKQSMLFCLKLEEENKVDNAETQISNVSIEESSNQYASIVAYDDKSNDKDMESGNSDKSNQGADFLQPTADNFKTGSNFESNTNEDSDETTAGKPKSRRRCSDLVHLEQWGWHKSRRYSSRKKTQNERIEVDTSLNGYLRKLFAKYMK